VGAAAVRPGAGLGPAILPSRPPNLPCIHPETLGAGSELSGGPRRV